MIQNMTGVVLAGGRSSRFGSDKALAPWGGATLLEAVVGNLLSVLPEVIVVSKDQARPALGPRVRLVGDLDSLRHPLAGLHAGLCACAAPWAFVCACDMPFIRPGMIRRVAARRAGVSAVVPRWRGRPEPLCAAYSRDCLPALERVLDDPGSMNDFLARLRVRWLDETEAAPVGPEGRSFLDIDDPAAYREALSWAR